MISIYPRLAIKIAKQLKEKPVSFLCFLRQEFVLSKPYNTLRPFDDTPEFIGTLLFSEGFQSLI